MASQMILDATKEALAERFDANLLQPDMIKSGLKRVINAFDHEPYPILSNASGNISPFHWGLVPPNWKKEPQAIWHLTYKAKLEYLDRKYTWKHIQSNRCIVPATAYFEYHWNDPKGKSKTKYRISSSQTKIFGLAGLFSIWKDPFGNTLPTFAICTTTGNETMKFVHNKDIAKDFYRMPVMLNISDERHWLDSSIYPSEFAYPSYQPNLVAEPCPGEDGVQIQLF